MGNVEKTRSDDLSEGSASQSLRGWFSRLFHSHPETAEQAQDPDTTPPDGAAITGMTRRSFLGVSATALGAAAVLGPERALAREKSERLPEDNALVRRLFERPEITTPEGAAFRKRTEYWHRRLNSDLASDLDRGWRRLMETHVDVATDGDHSTTMTGMQLVHYMTEKRGVPFEMIFAAFTESFWYNFSRGNRAGAKGIWQFTRGTGKLYGLIKERYNKKTRRVELIFDNRCDIEQSTDAAQRHFKDNYTVLKTTADRNDIRTNKNDLWAYVLTGYNGSIGKVVTLFKQFRGSASEYVRNQKIVGKYMRYARESTDYAPKTVAMQLALMDRYRAGTLGNTRLPEKEAPKPGRSNADGLYALYDDDKNRDGKPLVTLEERIKFLEEIKKQYQTEEREKRIKGEYARNAIAVVDRQIAELSAGLQDRKEAESGSPRLAAADKAFDYYQLIAHNRTVPAEAAMRSETGPELAFFLQRYNDSESITDALLVLNQIREQYEDARKENEEWAENALTEVESEMSRILKENADEFKTEDQVNGTSITTQVDDAGESAAIVTENDVERPVPTMIYEIQPADGLEKIATWLCGTSDRSKITAVQRLIQNLNPHITNIHRIRRGTNVTVPAEKISRPKDLDSLLQARYPNVDKKTARKYLNWINGGRLPNAGQEIIVPVMFTTVNNTDTDGEETQEDTEQLPKHTYLIQEGDTLDDIALRLCASNNRRDVDRIKAQIQQLNPSLRTLTEGDNIIVAARQVRVPRRKLETLVADWYPGVPTEEAIRRVKTLNGRNPEVDPHRHRKQGIWPGQRILVPLKAE